MPVPEPEVRTESDEDLLVFMGWRGEHPEIAKAACAEFYARHLNYVYCVVRRSFGAVLRDHGVEDMVMDTFARVYERALTYAPCGSGDRDVQRRNALAWVGKIAINACADYFRQPDTQLYLVDELDDRAQPLSLDEQPFGEPSGELALIQKAMETLSERERAIVRVTTAYWDFDRQHQRLPNQVVAELARSFDTTAENIRKIRERALKKIKQYYETARGALARN